MVVEKLYFFAFLIERGRCRIFLTDRMVDRIQAGVQAGWAGDVGMVLAFDTINCHLGTFLIGIFSINIILFENSLGCNSIENAELYYTY